MSQSMSFFHGRAKVLANRQLARATWLIRLQAPELAGAIRPGQFLMIRSVDGSDPLLGRPFALYDTVLNERGCPDAVDIVYLIVGKLTHLLSTLSVDDAVDVWGPLGNGFADLSGRTHVALVAGGIGQTPFLAHTRELLGARGYGGAAPTKQVERVSVYYGVRSADLAAGVDDFATAGAAVHIATDDGSMGFHGFVTQLLEEHLQSRSAVAGAPEHLIGCGPEPMMRSLSKLAQRWNIPCHLSLETPMACGVGICFSCVTPVHTDGGWDYRRVCVEGPVFEATDLVWGEGH